MINHIDPETVQEAGNSIFLQNNSNNSEEESQSIHRVHLFPEQRAKRIAAGKLWHRRYAHTANPMCILGPKSHPGSIFWTFHPKISHKSPSYCMKWQRCIPGYLSPNWHPVTPVCHPFTQKLSGTLSALNSHPDVPMPGYPISIPQSPRWFLCHGTPLALNSLPDESRAVVPCWHSIVSLMSPMLRYPIGTP